MSLPDELYNVKFADYLESIKAMYSSDDKFKTICDDYCNSKISEEIYKKKFQKYFRHTLESEIYPKN